MYIDHKPPTELVYHHKTPKSNKQESESEGMTNRASSCWMISVIQALRASDAFRREYAPVANPLKIELFKLFDIAEGKNGHKRRPVTHAEIQSYKRLAIEHGLSAKMDRGYLEQPFLRFLLKSFGAAPVEYRYSKPARKKRETILSISLKDISELRTLQQLIQEQTIALTSAPNFLPIFLKRPFNKQKVESSLTPIDPSLTLDIPIAKSNAKARYNLVSIIIGRDAQHHAYSYVLENGAWVEYNDSRVTIHKDPKTKKREHSKHTPFEDACKHGEILIYELVKK